MSDTTRASIKSFIKSWVNTPDNPRFAVLIEGKWGSGKTHFINEMLSNESFTKRKCIYISLFGIASIQDFERQLFYAASSTTAKIIFQGVGLASSVLSGGLSFATGGFFRGSADLGKVVESATAQVEKISSAIDKSFIVLDDLERCGFDRSDVLGVINRHVEHGDARVLIVANTNKIDDDRFDEFREKVVGQTFSLPSDATAAIGTFIGDVSDQAIKNVLLGHKEQIQDLYEKSGHNNLRATRQFVWQLALMLSAMKPEYLKNVKLIENVIHQAFIFIMEFKFDLGGGDDVLTPQRIWNGYSSKDAAERAVFEWRDSKESEPSKKRLILEKYHATNGITCSISIQQWISILEVGVIDTDWFNAELAQSEEVIGTDGWPSWRRLWFLYSWDFSDGSVTQFDEDVADMLAQINSGGYLEPLEFMHVFGVTLNLSRQGLIDHDPAEWVQRFSHYIDEFMVPNLNLERIKSVSRNHGSGYDGLGFTDMKKPEFQAVLEYMKNAFLRWQEDWKEEPAGEYLLNLLSTDVFKFLGNLKILNRSSEQIFLREPVLHQISPAAFLDTLLGLSRDTERMVLDSIAERYERRSELFDLEGPWWVDVKEELERRSAEEAIAPRSVQLRALSRGIDEDILSQWEEAKAALIADQIGVKRAVEETFLEGEE